MDDRRLVGSAAGCQPIAEFRIDWISRAEAVLCDSDTRALL